jgi:hypothetical protein
MPARKINPKILTSNLAYDAPMPASPKKIAYPSLTVQQKLMGPVVVPGDGMNHTLAIFTLPVDLIQQSVLQVGVKYTAILAGAGTTIQVALGDTTGEWQNGGSDITPVGGSTQGYMTIDLNMAPVSGAVPDAPQGQGLLAVFANNAVGNTLTINEVDLLYDCVAAIPVVGT